MQILTELSEVQRKAALLLADGTSVKGTAQAVKVSRVTVSTWKQNPAFMTLVREHIERNEQDARERVRSLQDKAVSRLSALLDSENEATALRAVIEVLDRSEKISRSLIPAVPAMSAEWAEALALIAEEDNQ